MSADGPPDWSSLPVTVIGGVIRSVVNTGRWRRDGPSLRAVCRPWCSCVNNSIEEMRLGISLRLKPEETKALIKFPRVKRVEVDITLRSCISAEDYSAVIEALSAMPSLSRLKLIAKTSPHGFVRNCRSTELSRVTSLELAAYLFPTGDDALPFLEWLKGMPLEELSIGASDVDLATLLKSAPGLRRLSIEGHVGRVSRDVFSKLRTMESVSLGRTGIAISQLQTIPGLKCVSLVAQPRHLKRIAQLTQIESLVLSPEKRSFRSCDLGCLCSREGSTVGVYDLGCLSTLSKLTSLEIGARHSSAPCECRFDIPLSQLKRLRLSSVRGDGTQIMGRVENLRSLQMELCTIVDPERFAMAVRDIERFGFRRLIDGSGSLISLSWVSASFHKLTVLSALVVEIRRQHQVHALLATTQLQKLHLVYNDISTPPLEFLEEVNEFADLRSLRGLALEDFPYTEEFLQPYLQIELMTKLVTLAMSASMYGFNVDVDDMLEMNEDVIALQRKAPWLKLWLSYTDVCAVVSEWVAQ